MPWVGQIRPTEVGPVAGPSQDASWTGTGMRQVHSKRKFPPSSTEHGHAEAPATFECRGFKLQSQFAGAAP